MLTIDQDNIGRDSSYFQSTDTDCFYEVRPQKYFGLNQEVAGLHATLKGAGLKDMLDNEVAQQENSPLVNDLLDNAVIGTYDSIRRALARMSQILRR